MNNIYYVYIHRRATDRSIFYVGKGKRERASNKSARNRYWRFIVAKHGFTHEIFRDGLTEEEAFALEVEVIRNLRDRGLELANLSDGGEGSSGVKHSYESIRKSADKKIGKKRSPETVKKMSESTKGRGMSKEWREKISKANTGKKHSAELIHKRTKHQLKRVSCSNGLEFKGIIFARDWLREMVSPTADTSSISLCLNGHKEHYFGFKWRFTDTEIK